MWSRYSFPFWSDVCRWLCRKCGPKPWFRLQGNHQKLERNLTFFRGFRRNVLTSEVGEKWLKNGLREPARPCCFPVLRPRFCRSMKLFLLWFLSHLHGNHQKCDPDFFVRFGAMCAAGFAGNVVQNHGFVCRETTKSWNETLHFLEDSDATFWHRRWGKSCMAFVSRPGHAVFPFWGLVSWGPRGFLVWFLQHLHGNHPECDPDIRFPFWSDVCRWLCRKCGPKPWFRLQGNHQKLERKRNLTFFRGFRRNVLTSEVGEKWLENGLREPARPCCFPVLRPRFLRSTRLSNPPTPASARGSAPWEGL